MKSDNIVFNKLETLFGYLQDVPMPANVTDTDGKLIFRNRLMEQAHRPWSEDNISGDAWVGGVKSDWSPDIPLGRRHDAPQDMPGGPDNLKLVAAVRIPGAHGAFVHLYASGSSAESGKAYELIGKVMELAGPAASSVGPSDAAKEPMRLDANWLCDVPLRDVVTSAAHAAGIPAGRIENHVDANYIIGRTNPFIIGRMAENILCETANAYPNETIHINSMEKTAAGAPSGATLLSFEIRIKGRLGKRNASELAAIGLRLKEFASVLGKASGVVMDAPAISRKDRTVQVHFLFPNRLIKTPSSSARASGATGALSSREREIMEMARAGYDNDSIAGSLGIATATVKQHLKSIYKKLGIRKRSELIFLDSLR